MLTSLDAIDGTGTLTDAGRAMRAIALPPRLARMLVEAKASGEAELAAEVSVLLTERNLGGDGADLVARIERFRRERSPRAEDARKLVKSLLKQADADSSRTEATDAGRHLAAAFRIALPRRAASRANF